MSYVAGTADSFRATVMTTATLLGPKLRTIGAISTPASTAWPAANDAFLIPLPIAVPTAVTGMFAILATTPGTTAFDLGIYRDDFTRVASIGATNAINTNDIPQPAGAASDFATPVTLPPGRYFMAMSSASTALTVRAAVNANGVARALGTMKMATAHPLPTTFVPATNTAPFIPVIGLTTTTTAII